MKNLLIATLVVGLCSLAIFFGQEEHRVSQAYEQWKIDFGAHYDEETDLYRRLIFKENLEKIDTHNADPERTYDMGVNQFTALTQEQFVSIYLNHDPKKSESVSVETPENG